MFSKKMREGNIKSESKIDILFFCISWTGILSFFVLLLLRNSDVANWLVMQHNYEWQFSDFFRQIAYASDLEKIYFNTNDAPFPPFAYLCFNLLYRMNPVNVTVELQSWKIIQEYQYNLLIYVMVFVLASVFFLHIVKRILGFKELKATFLVLSILFSAPVMSGAIERGNIAIIVSILLLYAMCLKDSNLRIERELALILIAISAGLKIYPAVFGVIYLREKRWKESGRLLLYGLLFFFLPFAFTGGFEGLKQYIHVLRIFEMSMTNRWTNIRSFLFELLDLLKCNKNIVLGMTLENSYLIICLISAIKTPVKWKAILFLTGIITLYVPNSYRYVAVYMIIPLVFWFKQQTGRSSDYIYCILFALVFTIPTYAYFFRGEVDLFIFLPIYILIIYALIETWVVDRRGKDEVSGIKSMSRINNKVTV